MFGAIKGIVAEIIDGNTFEIEVTHVIESHIETRCNLREKIRLKDNMAEIQITEKEIYMLNKKMLGRHVRCIIDNRDDQGYLVINELEIA